MANNPLKKLDKSVTCIIVCALHCEAKPIIDFYRLKKQSHIHPFDVYQADSVMVLVSGLGQHNMSAAINWFSGYLSTSNLALFWLNIGVAGHQSATIGDLFCASKIGDNEQQSNYFPSKWLKHKIKLESVISVDEVEQHYPQNCLYDMEAHAFYQSATRFNNNEQVQCLKIVSDNAQQAANKDKVFISNLIFTHIEVITHFIQQHIKAIAALQPAESIFQLEQLLLNSCHFSFSEKVQLKQSLLSAYSHDIDLTSFKSLDSVSSSNILSQLKQILALQAVAI